MSIHNTIETSDDYSAVLATFGPRYRAIADRSGLGWSVQKRRSNTGRWFRIAGPFIHRHAVASVVSSAVRGSYAADNGITDETILAALSDLPEIYRFSPSAMFPEPRRPPLAPSYKTRHDLRDHTNRADLTDPYLR
ncbi:hypothetical protein [Mesorhizobium sp. YM1C-6-2]|uniref:hypothetical protein n=1 Tax=Mesorhizobium sp. YM1C-6-2 TaxID=1827501 RepID=UPI000EF179BB|nr:hypothetical protein [Mesorhizobium sp. YM1C-6-2]RLP26598.1 hypothetical protein D8676_05000 [Mesorhizobium sp. YM1C-6-2]